MATTTYIQAASLLDDLKQAKGNGVSWQVGRVINALLEKAKEEQPDNVALTVMDPLRPGAQDKYIADMNADDVRAILGQIVAATRSAPSIA
jgi:hypothetical protein